MPAFALHVDSIEYLFSKLKLRKHTLDFALVQVGSLIVDLEELGILKNVHGKSEKFLQYLLKEDPKYAPLAVGMVMHEELDHHIDTNFTNVNIPKAAEILEQYELASYKVELGAHYLVDHCATCSFVEQKPKVIQTAEKVKKRLTKRHSKKIAFHLSKFFGGNVKTIYESLETLRSFDLKKYISEKAQTDLYATFLIMQEQITQPKLNIFTKIKLAFKYYSFMLIHGQKKLHRMLKRSKKEFSHCKPTYKKAKKALVKKAIRLQSTYGLTLK